MTKHDAQTLFALAKRISRLFAEQEVELLSYEGHSNLMEFETKLLAYANLLSVDDREKFLADEVKDARDYLADILLRERRELKSNAHRPLKKEEV